MNIANFCEDGNVVGLVHQLQEIGEPESLATKGRRNIRDWKHACISCSLMAYTIQTAVFATDREGHCFRYVESRSLGDAIPSSHLPNSQQRKQQFHHFTIVALRQRKRV